jgi:two-component system, OmpR family, alkaline phosphatase synthesis response regulator PhoP
MRVLLVEDDRGLRLTVGDRLRAEGYEVEVAADGASGYDKARGNPFDLIVLDVMLPRKSGLDVLRDLRRDGIATPVLMLTALGQTSDKVVGLKLGADDYLTKPFEMAELTARVEALLRRPAATTAAAPLERFRFGALSVDFRRTEVTLDGQRVTLSARELELLRYFIEHRGETLSREKILRDVWSYSSMTMTRTVDVHVGALRQKLESDPKKPVLILTVHKLGYKFTGEL